MPIDPAAIVAPDAEIGEGTSVWALAQIRSGVRLGGECVVGRGAFIDVGVVVGDRCKIQNNALVYSPAVLEEGVFVGPAVILTNDLRPRAVTADGALKRAGDWHASGVLLRRGCAVGAGAVVVAGVTVGAWAMVAAGAVVAEDVPDHALVGGVPARPMGWVCACGDRLVLDGDGAGGGGADGDGADGGSWRCPSDGAVHVPVGAGLARVDA